MGRARTKPQAIAVGAFNTLLGARRGSTSAKDFEDDIASPHPNAAAGKRQRLLLKQLRNNDVDATLQELRPHPLLLGDAGALIDLPLLHELSQALVQYQTQAITAAADERGPWIADLLGEPDLWSRLRTKLPQRLARYVPWVLYGPALLGGLKTPSAQTLKEQAYHDAVEIQKQLFVDHALTDDTICWRLSGQPGALAAPTWSMIFAHFDDYPCSSPPTAADRRWLADIVRG